MSSRTALVRAVMLAAWVTGAAGLTASRALAQRSTTRGWTLGAHLQGASLSVNDDDPSGGGGLSVRAGYGLNRHFTPYVELDGTSFDVSDSDVDGTWNMTHFDFGVRYNFANSLRRWVPFLEAAVGARSVRVRDGVVDGTPVGDLDFSGGVLSFGGGVAYYAREHLAIETLLKFSGGTFNSVDVGDVSVNNLDLKANSTRFKLGIAWWP